jgi:hypothetical protein
MEHGFQFPKILNGFRNVISNLRNNCYSFRNIMNGFRNIIKLSFCIFNGSGMLIGDIGDIGNCPPKVKSKMVINSKTAIMKLNSAPGAASSCMVPFKPAGTSSSNGRPQFARVAHVEHMRNGYSADGRIKMALDQALEA